MPEENPRAPFEREPVYPNYCTHQRHHAMKAKWSSGGAGIGALITYLIMRSCTGYSAGVSDQHGNAGVTQVNDAGIVYDAGVSKDKNSCYESLQSQLNDCNKKWGICEGKLESCVKDRDACVAERDELRKRPESCPTYKPRACPTYKPKACPPVKECPQLPYIRQGD